MASAARLIEVRHFWRVRKRMAEISVPAWPIPIQNTKLVISQPQPTGPLLPQTPTPVATSSVTFGLLVLTCVSTTLLVVAATPFVLRKKGARRLRPLFASGVLLLLVGDKPVFTLLAADLDPEFRDEFYYRLLGRLKAMGKTVFVVSHDQQYWLVADRLLNFQDGQLRELGKEEVRMLVSVGRKEE